MAKRPRRIALVALACCAVLPAADAGASPASPGPHAAHAAVAPCTSSGSEIWLGLGEGGGTAGTTYYPLEFTNVSHTACSFHGYPGVSAYGSNAHQIGQPASRNSGPGSVAAVVLAPGATAHAILGIHDAGAICSRMVNALGLTIYAPGQRSAQRVPFTFAACSSTSVLTVEPVRAGTGIPGYTTS